MTTSPSLALRLPKLVAACATLLDDERASVDARLAACAALAGAQGKRAFTALVAALDDGSARVREAAVDALVASCTGPHAPRIVHAAWHKRSDVRRLALHLASLPEPVWPPLLADPVLADDAAATLLARASVEPAAFAVVV
ncbi:MAG TPA: HEAT repeat domain-containing protein, partial [Myxococcota bacterium]